MRDRLKHEERQDHCTESFFAANATECIQIRDEFYHRPCSYRPCALTMRTDSGVSTGIHTQPFCYIMFLYAYQPCRQIRLVIYSCWTTSRSPACIFNAR